MDKIYINGSFVSITELITPIQNIQYRGSLNYCNYSCSYCPFSKKHYSQKKENADRNSLFRLLEKLKEIPSYFTFQIVPYGEALIHSYYWEFMALLSQVPQVKAVGCQTNASFPVQEMMEIFNSYGGITEKLRLWCSFHPTMISAEHFYAQIQQLKNLHITLCVGSVADTSKKEEISKLRSLLPKDIYFWLNQMDGRKNAYTLEDRTFFESIDPFFPLEEMHISARPQTCFAGFLDSKNKDNLNNSLETLNGNLFIEANGDIHACNLSRHILGNLYKETVSSYTKCSNRECHCFLSYQNNVTTLPELLLFFPYPSFRIPTYYQAVFFDIDHILFTEQETEVFEKVGKVLSVMSHCSHLYLVTSLSYSAAKKFHVLKPFLFGGIFADGAYITLLNDKKNGSILTENNLSIQEKDHDNTTNSSDTCKKNAIHFLCNYMNYDTTKILICKL